MSKPSFGVLCMIVSTGDRGHQSGSHKQEVWGRFIIFYIGEPGSLIGFTKARGGGF